MDLTSLLVKFEFFIFWNYPMLYALCYLLANTLTGYCHNFMKAKLNLCEFLFF
jgi:hypothetical protein